VYEIADRITGIKAASEMTVAAAGAWVAIHYRLSHVRHDWCRTTYCVPTIRLIHEETPKSDRSYVRSHVRNITVAR